MTKHPGTCIDDIGAEVFLVDSVSETTNFLHAFLYSLYTTSFSHLLSSPY